MDQETRNRLVQQTAASRLVNARQRSLEAKASGPHRMEYVATVKGVEYINDSKSTFLDSTLEAIGAMEKPVVWIAAGLDDGIAKGNVQQFLKDHVAALVLYGRGARSIEALQPFTQHVYFAEELRTAVFVAHELSRSGELVLFSPASPSGADGFANYEERGAEFKRSVKDL